MSELMNRVVRHFTPADDATWDDELRMAADYDRRRGYDRPLAEQAKDAHEMAQDAPRVRWVPPALRQRR